MNIFKLAWEILVIYIIYKLIVGFFIPLFRSARKMRSQINELREKMQQQQQSSSIHPSDVEASPESEGEYIEYEEIKDRSSY